MFVWYLSKPYRTVTVGPWQSVKTMMEECGGSILRMQWVVGKLALHYHDYDELGTVVDNDGIRNYLIPKLKSRYQ